MSCSSSSGITFVRPRVDQYPFDRACRKIVEKLEELQWEVEGIEVSFRDICIGDKKFRQVSSVKGAEFSLLFSRNQGALVDARSGAADTAAVCEVCIPGHKVRVYEDMSCPFYLRYIGKDWSKDKKRFEAISCFAQSRETALFHRYTGVADPNSISIRAGEKSPYLLRMKGGRGELLEKEQWKVLSTDEIFAQVQNWLEEHVLNAL